MKHRDTEFESTKLPFGQYQGLQINKIKDIQYLEWYLKKFDHVLKPNVKYAIQLKVWNK